MTDFYAHIVDIYDHMTGFEFRLEREQAALSVWKDRYQLQQVVDMGCGTGLHAIALARLGLKVIAADPCAAMITRARENANRHSITIDWLTSPMQGVEDAITTPQDAVFCLGNTIPHVLTRRELNQAIRSLIKIVKPGGIIVFQLLNYQRILYQQERIVGVKRHENWEFVRFYDFLATLIRFNILTIDWSVTPPRTRLVSTDLYPYEVDEIVDLLKLNTISKVELFSDLNFAPFDAAISRDVVCVAQL